MMMEPIICLNSTKDSMDIMLEMKMFDILSHPIIVEVLNLVYEGEYSVDSSILSMSQTFSQLFNSETFSFKSINQKILDNINSLGLGNQQKQIGIQLNIWK